MQIFRPAQFDFTGLAGRACWRQTRVCPGPLVPLQQGQTVPADRHRGACARAPSLRQRQPRARSRVLLVLWTALRRRGRKAAQGPQEALDCSDWGLARVRGDARGGRLHLRAHHHPLAPFPGRCRASSPSAVAATDAESVFQNERNFWYFFSGRDGSYLISLKKNPSKRRIPCLW